MNQDQPRSNAMFAIKIGDKENAGQLAFAFTSSKGHDEYVLSWMDSIEIGVAMVAGAFASAQVAEVDPALFVTKVRTALDEILNLGR